LSVSTVDRVWRAFALQPHRSETFKPSTDPLFVDKVRDIVSLYLNPSDGTLVLCIDAKSQIQALDRTQPLLPVPPGQAERRPYDYKRHGTTALFAALDVKVSTIFDKCLPRHRSQEFRRFLDTVETHVPGDLQIVMDNAPGHKTKLIRDWFAKRPRWQMHVTPTSSSWINQVERFFAFLTDQQIKLGAPPRWRPRSPPTSPPATPTPGRSVGPERPATSSPPSNAFVAASSRSKPNVRRNF